MKPLWELIAEGKADHLKPRDLIVLPNGDVMVKVK